MYKNNYRVTKQIYSVFGMIYFVTLIKLNLIYSKINKLKVLRLKYYYKNITRRDVLKY